MPVVGIGPQGDDGLHPRTAFTITPSDVTDLSLTCTKGLYVTVAGNLSYQLVDSAAAVLIPVLASQRIEGHVKFVKAATTATVVGYGG